MREVPSAAPTTLRSWTELQKRSLAPGHGAASGSFQCGELPGQPWAWRDLALADVRQPESDLPSPALLAAEAGFHALLRDAACAHKRRYVSKRHDACPTGRDEAKSGTPLLILGSSAPACAQAGKDLEQ